MVEPGDAPPLSEPAKFQAISPPGKSNLRSLQSFILSVMPSDRAFFFLLLGSTFLYISNSLGWWNGWQTEFLRPSRISGTSTIKNWGALWRTLLTFASFPVEVAGAAGFFVSFFPGPRPLRRLRLWVYLPAAIGFVLTFLLILVSAVVINPSRNPWGAGRLFSVAGVLTLLWNAGPGLHYTVLGLIFIILGATRIRRGLAVLPIHLKSSSIDAGEISLKQRDQHNVMRFVWVAITLLNQGSLIAGSVVGVTVGTVLNIVYFRDHKGSSFQPWPLMIFTSMVIPALLLSLILWLAGKSRLELLRSSFRLPYPEYFGIALISPIAVYALPPIFGSLHPLGSPSSAGISHFYLIYLLLYLFFAAFVEEVAWRGYLQPRFIARFGVYRGIVFVGIVWAAFQFSGDFREDQTDANVVRVLVERLLGACLIGFFLSWLTLRSKSLLPAVVAHAMTNAIARFGVPFLVPFWLTLVLWAVIDLLLFRFWPPREIASLSSATLPSGAIPRFQTSGLLSEDDPSPKSMPAKVDAVPRPKKRYVRSRGLKDLVFLVVVVALGFWTHHFLTTMKGDLTDLDKWKVRPKLDPVATHKPGESGPNPCLFILPPGAVDQPVASGSIGDCILFVPDGRKLDLYEVKLWSGDFLPIKTDLYVPGSIPLAFTRTYCPPDEWSTKNQLSLAHVFGSYLLSHSFENRYANLSWYLLDGQEIYYRRISPGTGYADAVFGTTATLRGFEGSRINWNGWGWDLTLEDGTTFLSPEAYFSKRPQQGSIVAIFDKDGNEVRFSRESNGDLTSITSPDGKWIHLTYGQGQIIRATDSQGNSVEYLYDGRGRLEEIRNSRDEIVKYDFNMFDRIVKISDANGRTVLENTYQPATKVSKLSLPGGISYLLEYNLDEDKKIASVDITGPMGERTRVTLSARWQEYRPYYKVESLPRLRARPQIAKSQVLP